LEKKQNKKAEEVVAETRRCVNEKGEMTRKKRVR